MENGYVLNVMSDDHPGILAGVTEMVLKLGGNIVSCSQTVLDTYFTLIMTFTISESREITDLKSYFRNAEALQGCQIMIRPMSEPHSSQLEKNHNIYVITAFGEDRKGIVAAFCQYLAGKEINILDFYGKITHDNEFVLIGQAEVDPKLDTRILQLELEALARENEFTVRLQHNNIFVATNQLRLDN